MSFLLVTGSVHSFVVYADPPAQIEGEWIQASDGRWWYRHTDGTYTTNAWECINGYWYHFDPDGWMQTGWLQINSYWYYLAPNGVMCIGWQEINNYWYYFASNGRMYTGWHIINDNTYYFAPNGVMCIGWQYLNGSWYFFNDNGSMRTSILYQSSRKYEFYPTGRLRSTRILIPRQQQEKDHWCWAACAVMVGKYQTNSTKSQSDVVLYVKHQIIDEGGCDWETNQALYYASDFSKIGAFSDIDDFPYSEAVSQINGNRPFIIRMNWNNGKTHMVVGAGYMHGPNSIYIIDPWYSCASEYYPYSDLKNGTQIKSGIGSWALAISYTNIN